MDLGETLGLLRSPTYLSLALANPVRYHTERLPTYSRTAFTSLSLFAVVDSLICRLIACLVLYIAPASLRGKHIEHRA